MHNSQRTLIRRKSDLHSLDPVIERHLHISCMPHAEALPKGGHLVCMHQQDMVPLIDKLASRDRFGHPVPSLVNTLLTPRLYLLFIY